MIKYDFHIHSCLSPCADDDMTPANIAGMSFIAGLGAIAVTDHNSFLNAAASHAACKEYGIKYLFGTEVCSDEEIHILCFFKDGENLDTFCRKLEESTLKFPNDPSIYGNQLAVDEKDNVTGKVDYMLITSCGMSSYEIINLCRDTGGISFWAHIDKNSYSVISVLGSLPTDFCADGVEIHDLSKRQKLIDDGYITENTPFISDSDAHTLGDIGQKENYIDSSHILYRYIQSG